MKAFVLDAALAVSWFFPTGREGQDAAALEKRALFATEVALVTHLWSFEIVNFIAMQRRRNTITEAEGAWNLAQLLSIPFAAVDEGSPEASVALCVRYGLTAYEASYLQVAMEQGVPLATLDPALIKAARDLGVALA